MAHCTKCGQLIPNDQDADWLLDLLTNGEPHRQVYRGQDGNWYVTYGGGEVSASVVGALVKRGAVVSVYSNCPNDAYHVGRTLDYERTMAARKKHGRGAPNIYIQQTPGA
jgi:hypothetical protein